MTDSRFNIIIADIFYKFTIGVAARMLHGQYQTSRSGASNGGAIGGGEGGFADISNHGPHSSTAEGARPSTEGSSSYSSTASTATGSAESSINNSNTNLSSAGGGSVSLGSTADGNSVVVGHKSWSQATGAVPVPVVISSPATAVDNHHSTSEATNPQSYLSKDDGNSAADNSGSKSTLGLIGGGRASSSASNSGVTSPSTHTDTHKPASGNNGELDHGVTVGDLSAFETSIGGLTTTGTSSFLAGLGISSGVLSGSSHLHNDDDLSALLSTLNDAHHENDTMSILDRLTKDTPTNSSKITSPNNALGKKRNGFTFIF